MSEFGIRSPREQALTYRLRGSRRLCLMLTVLLVAYHVCMQQANAEPDRFEIGAELAPSMEEHVGERADPDAKYIYKLGGSVGVGLRYAWLNWLSAQAELLYATRGSDIEYMGQSDGGTNFTYIELPLLARVRIPLTSDAVRPRLSGYAVLGPSLSGLVGGESVDLAGRADLDREYLHALDFGVIGGLGMSWEVAPQWALSLEARYDRGFTDAFNAIESKNQAFLLAIGVDFTLAHGDHDGDRVADYRDRCPAQLEDMNGYEDDDGCADATEDEDGDGLLAAADQCPAEPEDMNGYKDEDGCPDATDDADKDGIPDASDRCPDVAFPRGIGCPPSFDRVTVERYRLVLTNPIEFDKNVHALNDEHIKTLDQVAELMMDYYPEMRLLVEGHADGENNERQRKNNRQESELRASAVAKYLVGKGVARERLVEKGYGDEKPIRREELEEGKRKNRRIELIIIQNDEP